MVRIKVYTGFHRWRLSLDSQELLARYRGLVPCCRLAIDEAEAKIITVRINRAKGTHTAVRMSELVKQLIDDHGQSPDAIAKGIGATLAEIDLLYQDSIFKSRNLADAPYSKAWYPAEDGRKGGRPVTAERP